MHTHKFTQGFIAVLACSMLVSGSALAGIKGSKHDLGAGGAGQGATTTPNNTTEVCVFCHTPHGSNTGVTAPLWNKVATDLTVTTYNRYSTLGTATLDGEEVAVGSVSMACLSCHDGTQAMDVVVNGPGAGNYVATGAAMSGPTSTRFMTGTPIPMLGTDLSNDHPISIAYAGGACTANTNASCDPQVTTGAGTYGDPDFKPVTHGNINGQDQWWVDTAVTGGVAGTRQKTDMILYARDFTGANNSTPGRGPSVECASCHDPHEDTSTPVSFLRINNDGSAVCLACHTK